MSVIRTLAIASGIVLPALDGCSFYTVNPGHVGLAYQADGGLQRMVIPPGRVFLGHFCALHTCREIYDFDVTYTMKHETVQATSSDPRALALNVTVIYRPIIDELYELATEIGTDDRAYYNKIVGPEFRAAAAIVIGKHSSTELTGHREAIEDEIEAEVRRRIKGKHIELSSVTIEAVTGLEGNVYANRAGELPR